MNRIWHSPTEPDGVRLVRDTDGQLWQHCSDYGWQRVKAFRHNGLNHSGRPWEVILGLYGPITEVPVPDE